MQSAPREGTECYLKQPAWARRGTQPPPLCFNVPGVRFRGPVWLPAWACLGLQWSGLLVRLRVRGASKWVDGKTMAFAPEPGPCTPITQTVRHDKTTSQPASQPTCPTDTNNQLTFTRIFPWQPLLTVAVLLTQCPPSTIHSPPTELGTWYDPGVCHSASKQASDYYCTEGAWGGAYLCRWI